MAKGSAISFIGGTAIAVLLLFCGPSDVRGGAPESSDDQGANTTTYQAWQDHLAGEGITISFQWQADVFANVRGGSREGAVTDGLVRQDLDLDCQKLTRLAFFDDTEIHVEGIYPYGTDISTLVGDIGGVNNNAAYNSPRLNEIWFQKRFQVGTANLVSGPVLWERTRNLMLMAPAAYLSILRSAPHRDSPAMRPYRLILSRH